MKLPIFNIFIIINIYTHFIDEEIDKSSFFKLTENMIKSLIPKIGTQAKFLSNLNELKNHGDTNINHITDEFNKVKLIQILNLYDILKFVKYIYT